MRTIEHRRAIGHRPIDAETVLFNALADSLTLGPFSWDEDRPAAKEKEEEGSHSGEPTAILPNDEERRAAQANLTKGRGAMLNGQPSPLRLSSQERAQNNALKVDVKRAASIH